MLGLWRGGLGGYSLAALGGYMLFRGTTGYCPVNEAIGRDNASAEDKDTSVNLSNSIVVERPVEEVYAFWRKLENLPRFMSYLKTVSQTSEKQSDWEAHIPGDLVTIQWKAEITGERPNEYLAWRSLPGADVENSGEVQFEGLPNGQRTVIHATITYRPPAANAGALVAKLLNPVFEGMVKGDLDRFKKVIEGEKAPQGAGLAHA